ncbi:hypothetical protein [Roseovarius sp.]|uniref:spike base protein, RCAP_Rcc01079 family n=1 Tax=Roseovarius sp. TaxID=1486281 RepID=UPI0035161F06
MVTIALYVGSGCTLVFDAVARETRTAAVADSSKLPLGTVHVQDNGTTPTGIHALVLK